MTEQNDKRDPLEVWKAREEMKANEKSMADRQYDAWLASFDK